MWSSEAAGEPEQPEPDDAVNEEARVETDPTHRYSRVSDKAMLSAVRLGRDDGGRGRVWRHGY